MSDAPVPVSVMTSRTMVASFALRAGSPIASFHWSWATAAAGAMSAAPSATTINRRIMPAPPCVRTSVPLPAYPGFAPGLLAGIRASDRGPERATAGIPPRRRLDTPARRISRVPSAAALVPAQRGFVRSKRPAGDPWSAARRRFGGSADVARRVASSRGASKERSPSCGDSAAAKRPEERRAARRDGV